MLRSLLLFTALAYGLAWAAWLPLILRNDQVVPGALPTHMHGLLAPAVAAFIASGIEGRHAVRDLANRVLRFRMPIYAWLLALSPFVVVFVAFSIQAATSTDGLSGAVAGLKHYSGVPDFGLIGIVLVIFVANCLGEEIGWRGFALPRLQARLGPLRGTLVLFVMWAAWHFPLFFIVATFMQMTPSLIAFGWLLGLLAGALVLAHVTHIASGAVLAPALWHLGFNLSSATDLGGFAPAVATTGVMIWAIWLLWVSRTQSGRLHLLVPRPP